MDLRLSLRGFRAIRPAPYPTPRKISEIEMSSADASFSSVLTWGVRSARSIIERYETLIPARSASSSCEYPHALRSVLILWPRRVDVLGTAGLPTVGARTGQEKCVGRSRRLLDRPIAT